MNLASSPKQKFIDTKQFQGTLLLAVVALFGYFIYAVWSDTPYHPLVLVLHFLPVSSPSDWLACAAMTAAYLFLGIHLMLLVDGQFRRRAEIAEAGSMEAYRAKKQKEREVLAAAQEVQKELKRKRDAEIKAVNEQYADLSDDTVARLTLHRLEQIHALLTAQKPTSN